MPRRLNNGSIPDSGSEMGPKSLTRASSKAIADLDEAVVM